MNVKRLVYHAEIKIKNKKQGIYEDPTEEKQNFINRITY